MALSLAACGSSSTSTTDASDTDTETTPTPNELTYDTDTLSGSGTFDAGLVWSPGGDTRVESLQSDDNITGTGTADVINITSDGGTIAPTFTGLETVNYSISSTTAGTLNLANATGTDTVSMSTTAGDIGLSGVGTDISVTVKNIADAAADAFVNVKASAVTGTADAMTVEVSNVNGGNVNIGSGAAAGTAGTGVETLTLNSSGEASTIASLGSAVSTLNVGAASDLTLTAVTATGLKTVDASTSTGDVSMNVASNISANTFSYTGGAGDDTLIADSGFTGTDSLDGGAGSDTLSIRSTSDIAAVGALNSDDAAVVSNFETLDMRANDDSLGTARAVDFTVDMDHLPGVTAITMRAADESGKSVFTLNDLTATQAGALTMTHTGSDADTDSEIIVDMKANATDTVVLNATVSADTQVVEVNDANNNVENLTINLSGAKTSNVDYDNSSFLTTVTMTGGASGKSMTLANSVKSATFDASTFIGDIASFTTAGSTQTIKTGSGDDTVVLNAGVKTVDMGAGDDTVSTTVALLGTGATSWDTIAAGAGTDTLLVTTMAAVTAEAASGLSGFERLKIDASADVSANVTVNLANFSNNGDFSRITIGDTHDDVLTISSVGSSFTDLRFDADAETDTEATIERLVDSSSNAITVTITGGETVKTLTMNDEETVTITSSNTSAATISTLSATDATSLVATGSGNVIISNAVTGTKVTSVDVSGLSAAATVNVSNSTSAVTATGNAIDGGVFTFTGGSNTDNITGGIGDDVLSGGNGADTINGGAGADTIIGGKGADIITGGAGVDVYREAAPETDANGGDKIQDFAAGTGGDEIEVNITTSATVSLEEIAADALTAKEADNGDVFVITGGTVVDTSGNETADLAALNDVLMAGSTSAEKGAEVLVVVNGDTDGDGTADMIQVFYLHETGGTTTGTTFDEVEHIADLVNISATTDLAGDFVSTNFDFY